MQNHPYGFYRILPCFHYIFYALNDWCYYKYNSICHLIMAIYLENKLVQSDKRSLLFIDEIQNSPEAVAMLRYFHEEFPDLHVIAAGSLHESLIDKQISFPVGRVEYLPVMPCFLNWYIHLQGSRPPSYLT